MYSHQQKIIEQFTQQAIPFTHIAGHHDAIDVLIDLVAPAQEDTVLDVACGPGIVTCAFAGQCSHVTGLDVTPAMIEQARKWQIEFGAANITWQIDTCLPLPFADWVFSLVVTRYSFHHFLNPAEVLTEMIRVCRPGGRILVADIALPPEKAQAFDQMEVIRDPSHVHALTSVEFERLIRQSGLKDCRRTQYEVKIELEAQIEASFPLPGDAERLRSMITDDIGVDRFGITPKRKNGQIWYSIPIAVYVGTKKRGSK
ncbi:MAG: methyltransferase domain-containing protein [Desulfobulbus sp.]|nr:methyltransferase domain-containing protein [Desulfobulbus sp.]